MARSLLKNHIARRLIIYILVFSSVVTLSITASQLYYEFNQDVNALHRHLDQIETGYVSGIAEATWVVDKRQLAIMLEGISKLQDIEYVSVKANDGELFMQYGFLDNKLQVIRDIPLNNVHRGKKVTIGVLRLIAGLEGIYERLYDRVWVTLGANAAKTFIIALFVYYLFIHLVTRHLGTIASFTRQINLETPRPPLQLDRPSTTHDELDTVSTALNSMVEQLRGTYMALQASERRHQEIASSIPGVVYQLRLDKQGSYNLSYISEGVQELFGLSVSEIEHDADILFARIVDQDQKGFFESLKISANNLSPWFREFRLKTKSGGEHWVLGSAVPSVDSKESINWNGIMLDVTRQKLAEQEAAYARGNLEAQVLARTRELEIAKEEAVQANQAKSGFLSRMSHELRTPLNVIMGYSYIAERLSKDENVNAHLQEIHIAANHLLDLIKDIMDLSRIETGDLKIELTRVNLKEVIEASARFLANDAKTCGIPVSLLDCRNDIDVLTDSLRLKEVIMNLLSNAIKYNRKGGKVDIHCHLIDTDMVRVEIVDTGIGLDEEQLAQLFEPFSRLGAEFTDIEGTGVGLVIAKSLIERMNGQLTVSSVAKQGSCFAIILPLYK